jgi:hypothetical protein
MWLQILAARLQREWERARREWEKFGQHGATLRTDVKNEERNLYFKGGREERPPLHAYKCHSQKRGSLIKAGAP